MTCNEFEQRARAWLEDAETPAYVANLLKHADGCRRCSDLWAAVIEEWKVVGALKAIEVPAPGDVFWQAQRRDMRQRIASSRPDEHRRAYRTVRALTFSAAVAASMILVFSAVFSGLPMRSGDPVLGQSRGQSIDAIDDVVVSNNENPDLDVVDLDEGGLVTLYRALVASSHAEDPAQEATLQATQRGEGLEPAIDEVAVHASDDDYWTVMQDLEEIEI